MIRHIKLILIILIYAFALVSCNNQSNGVADIEADNISIETNDVENSISNRKNKKYYGDYFCKNSIDRMNNKLDISTEISLTEPNNAEVLMVARFVIDQGRAPDKIENYNAQLFGTFEVKGGYINIGNWSKIIGNNIFGSENDIEEANNMEFRLSISNFPNDINLQMKDKNDSEIIVLSDANGVKFTRQ